MSYRINLLSYFDELISNVNENRLAVIEGDKTITIKEKNPNLKGNQRDYADIRQLLVLCNIENLNAIMINDNIPQSIRIEKLNKVAIQQLEILENNKNLEELNTNSIKQIDTKQK